MLYHTIQKAQVRDARAIMALLLAKLASIVTIVQEKVKWKINDKPIINRIYVQPKFQIQKQRQEHKNPLVK